MYKWLVFTLIAAGLTGAESVPHNKYRDASFLTGEVKSGQR
jgi:hypothetical protein